MADLSLATVEEVMVESRHESSVGNFPDALQILSAIDGPSSSTYAVRTEICRLRIILGDHKSIALSGPPTIPIDRQESETFNDLLDIQLRLSRISTCGDIAQSLQPAKSLFEKYGQDMVSEELQSSVVS